MIIVAWVSRGVTLVLAVTAIVLLLTQTDPSQHLPLGMVIALLGSLLVMLVCDYLVRAKSARSARHANLEP